MKLEAMMMKKRIFGSACALLLMLFLSGAFFNSGCTFVYPSYIVISSTGNTLDAEVDPNFGKAKWFILVNTETMEYEAIEGVGENITSGAGKAAAELIIATGVKGVLTGEIGGNAAAMLSAAGIYVFTGASGTVSYAIEQYKLKKF
jgi:predicted Fe-Mo cluster-binding NifX family protein